MTFEEEVKFYLENFDKESLAKLYVIALKNLYERKKIDYPNWNKDYWTDKDFWVDDKSTNPMYDKPI